MRIIIGMQARSTKAALGIGCYTICGVPDCGVAHAVAKALATWCRARRGFCEGGGG
jgi:hypothetical protein